MSESKYDSCKLNEETHFASSPENIGLSPASALHGVDKGRALSLSLSLPPLRSAQSCIRAKSKQRIGEFTQRAP